MFQTKSREWFPSRSRDDPKSEKCIRFVDKNFTAQISPIQRKISELEQKMEDYSDLIDRTEIIGPNKVTETIDKVYKTGEPKKTGVYLLLQKNRTIARSEKIWDDPKDLENISLEIESKLIQPKTPKPQIIKQVVISLPNGKNKKAHLRKDFAEYELRQVYG